MTVRLGNSSDGDVFYQVFQLDQHANLRDLVEPRFILDLGANVGYSSAYFLNCFPAASLVAVEPDPDSFELCRENLASYGQRAKIVLGAAWSKRAKLVLCRGAFGDGREWTTQVREAYSHESGDVEGWDIPGLMGMSGRDQIDLLKVDIERSEMTLFGENSSSWLPKVRTICIELHGADCEAVFLRALKDFDYDLECCGELTICRNLRPKTAPDRWRPHPCAG